MPEQTVQAAAGATAVASREQTRSDEWYVSPPVDIYEEKTGLVVVADLPGASPESLEVRVDQGVLTLQARTAHVAPGQVTRREFELVSFFRQFQLPEKVDVSQISADLANGVLKLRLPWAPVTQPRKVEVRVN